VTRRARTALAVTTAALAAVVTAGCGLGPGRGASGVNLNVTRAFGQRPVRSVTEAKVPGSETVMRMLERSFNVTTRYGGGFVESIDGVSGNSSRLDWFYYVNGIQAPVGAASTAVHRGDRIWWDLHDWSATDSIPAVVGSFPEPFLHGAAGKRLPTTVECAQHAGSACGTVTSALSAAGIPVASQLLGTGSGSDSLGVLVGTWRQLRPVIAGALIDRGPGSSGVYARFTPDAARLQLLDPRGAVRRTLGPGAGLVAATARGSEKPTWFVTGVDSRGVLAAARALTPARLRNHFALAVSGTSGLPIPIQPAR
jgi:Domain of unknown function (DUF4430)